MGRTEGKNGSFMAMRMRIHQKLCSSLTPSGPEAMPKFLIVMCIYGVFAKYCFCIAGHSLGALVYLKNKIFNSGNSSVFFFSCLKKFKCLGDILDSVTPITVDHIEVPSFGCFYNLAQILI